MNSQFLPGNPKQCKTCIFSRDGIALSPQQMQEIVGYLCEGRQHVCHSNSAYACRGGRDIQLRLFYLKRWISAPTDEALEMVNQQYLEKYGELLITQGDEPIETDIDLNPDGN